MDARPVVKPKEIRYVPAFELLFFFVEQRRPKRMEIPLYIFVGSTQTNSNGHFPQGQQLTKEIGNLAGMAVQKGEHHSISAHHGQQISYVYGFSQIGQYAPHTSGMAT